jgi:hypothetical protein
LPKTLSDTWTGLDVSKVFKINYRGAFAYLGEMFGLPLHDYSLLDTRPLVNTVVETKALDWSRLPESFAPGTWLRSAGVVATEVAARGRAAMKF